MSGGEIMEEHLEIERRFFVDQEGEKPWKALEASSKVIQYYLDVDFLHLQGHALIYNGAVEIIQLEEATRAVFLSEKDWTVRIRFRDERTTLTHKGRRTNATAAELEWNIERALGLQIVAQREHPFVEKRRYLWNGVDGFVWEVDEFEGELSPLVLAEVELPAEDTSVELPAWLGEEITGDHSWSNASLAHRKSEFTQD
jgi:adenylate cyclase